MSKKKKKPEKKQKEDRENINHGRKAMITTEGPWIVWRFEFDVGEGQGVAWHQGRCTGQGNSVENSTRHFIDKGYTVVTWGDV